MRTLGRIKIVVGLLAVALVTGILSAWHPVAAEAAEQAGTFVSLAPARVLDTRIDKGAPGPVAPNSTIRVQVAGAGGVPSTGVSAVVINVTVTDAAAAGYVTVYPDGTSRPTASNLNYPAGDTRANLVTVRLGSNGKVALASSNRSTIELVADVAGYYLDGTPSAAGAFVSLPPTRLLDTRGDNGATGPVVADSTIHVQVAGRGGIPSSGVSAVVINVTVTEAGSPGYVTVYPDGTSRPTASNLNYPAGDTRANLVTVRLGSNGKIALASSNADTVQLVGDVAGYFLAGTPTAVGAFVSLAPTRLLDTRSNYGAPGPVGANSTIRVQVAGRSGVPSSGVSAVVINTTATDARLAGYVTAFPDGTGRPTASNLNYPAGDTRANLITVRLGSNGKVALASSNSNTVQLVGDVAGYYRSSTTDTTPPGPVTGLRATPTATSVALSWTNPTDSDFAGVMVRRRTGGTPPTTPSDGTLLTTTTGTSYIDGARDAGVTYSYALFTFDKVPNYGGATTKTVTTPVPTTMPANDWSFYVTRMDYSTAAQLGCDQGKFDASHGNINSTVILDFGGQNSSNTGTLLTFSNTSVTYSAIEAYAETFAYNYWSCTGANDKTSQLTLALGTNNSAYYVNSAGGAAWAGVVNAVVSYLKSHGYGQVVVWGANDIELSWNTYSNTANWESGYASHTSAMYLDFGDAAGCPPYGSCTNGWTQYQVWMMAWGFAPAQVAPEIYYTSQGTEWQAISNTQGRIHFWAPLDEYTLDKNTLTPSGAWSALGCSTGAQYCSAKTQIHKSN